MSALEIQNDALEQYTRRNSLRIYGLPEKEGENTDDLILDFASNELDLNLTLESIDRSHRLGRPNQSRGPRPIIVKFISYRIRQKIYKKRTSLRRRGNTIFVNEDLTAKRASLSKRARELRKQRPNQIANTWTSDGRIFIEESQALGGHVRVINSEEDLVKYLRLNISMVTSTPTSQR